MANTPVNFLGIPAEFSNYEQASSVVFSIPFDAACSWQRGASKGPDAIIQASMNLELYDIETKSEPYRKGIHTTPFLQCTDPAQMMAQGYSEVQRFLKDGKFVITLGGDHSIPYGPIRAHAERYRDMTILHVDAHLDRREEYDGNKYSHASIIQRVKGMVSKVVSVGIRSADRCELEDLPDGDVFWAHEMAKDPSWISKVVERLGSNVYITFDVDAFDISLMQSTGTPEPGGLGWYETLHLLRRVVTEKNVVGLDVVELLPGTNPAADFMIAKLIYKVLAYRALIS